MIIIIIIIIITVRYNFLSIETLPKSRKNFEYFRFLGYTDIDTEV